MRGVSGDAHEMAIDRGEQIEGGGCIIRMSVQADRHPGDHRLRKPRLMAKSPDTTELIANLLSPEIERTRLGVLDCGPSFLLVAVLLIAQTKRQQLHSDQGVIDNLAHQEREPT